MSQPSPSWVALQLAEQLRTIEGVAAGAAGVAQALGPDVALELEPRLGADDVDELKLLCGLLAEVAEQAHQLAELLPDDDLAFSSEEVWAAAAKDLAFGIIDPTRARLAARVLPAAVGWSALADALRHSDTQSSWQDLLVGELLRAFRNVDEQHVVRVLADADVAAEVDFASCDPEELVRLAAALERHAPGQ